ncbi:MAG: septal ring lytic transglycosylase RlpA family protein [Bacteroidota bacterium]
MRACFSIIVILLLVAPPADAAAWTAADGTISLRGKASYYASKFEGRRTANGERYREGMFTAAHRTLAFGTVVRVTNTLDGSATLVRINDRGPFSRGRIIDVSRIAAQRLDMLQRGVVPVRLDVVGPPLVHLDPQCPECDRVRVVDRSEGKRQIKAGGRLEVRPRLIQEDDPEPPPTPQQNQALFAVQLGSYSTKAAADRSAQAVDGGWVYAVSVDGKNVFRVFSGTFDNAADAAERRRALAARGVDGFVKRIR